MPTTKPGPKRPASTKPAPGGAGDGGSGPDLTLEVATELPDGLALVPEPEPAADAIASALAKTGSAPMQVKRIARRAGGQGVALTMSVQIKPRREGEPSTAWFDPWTATQQEAQKLPGGIASPDFGDWIVAQALKHNRKAIESDGVTLLSAVDTILGRGMRAPQWLAQAFTARWGRFNRFEIRTLDEVFGHEPLDPRTVRAARRSAGMVNAVHAALCEAVRAEPGEPIHAGFPFEQVAERFGIGKTLCYELYRKAVDQLGLQDLSELRWLLNQSGPKTARRLTPGEASRSPGSKKRR